ncbi:MAG TPA: hypothetical protein VM184_05425 [Gaiellaceae bacterium]|nr:hypothetical protein [Gaiellaceae bacterium]
MLRLAASLIALGGLFLGVKAGAIMLTGEQPPLLFGAAGLPLGLGLLLLARWCITRCGSSRRLRAAATLSSIAALASALATLMELSSMAGAGTWDDVEPPESILAVSAGFGPIVAALLIGLRLRAITGSAGEIGRRALLVAVMFLPLVILGGVAVGLAGERFLEVGLFMGAMLWLPLAQSLWRTDADSVVDAGSFGPQIEQRTETST